MNPVTIAWVALAAVGSWMFFRYPSPKFKVGQNVQLNYGVFNEQAPSIGIPGKVVSMRKIQALEATPDSRPAFGKKTWEYEIKLPVPLIVGNQFLPTQTYPEVSLRGV